MRLPSQCTARYGGGAQCWGGVVDMAREARGGGAGLSINIDQLPNSMIGFSD